MFKGITPNTRTKFHPTCGQVQIKAFNTNDRAWKDSCLVWLDEMREQRFGLIEGHSLELRSVYCCENFIILAVERSTAPIRPLPPKIYFARFELTFWSGHDIHIDCGPPPVTTIRRHFWEQREGRGRAPHFECHVLPLVDELVSNFEGGESWAS